MAIRVRGVAPANPPDPLDATIPIDERPFMAFHAYILGLANGAYYVGHTEALEPRLHAHRLGMLSDYMRRRRPVRLLWSQDFEIREEALAAERWIKRWSRAKKDALIAGDWDALRWYARAPREREGDPPEIARPGQGPSIHSG